MVEKADSQELPEQPPSTEPQLIIETRKYAHLFFPSPLEEAFDAEIQGRFQTALLEPGIDEHGRLIRVSYPVITGDSLVAFQYTRYDLLRGDPEQVAEALLPQNPSLSEIITGTEFSQGEIGPLDDLDVFQDLSHQKIKARQFLSAIRKRIIERDGEFDPKRAVSDPTYYTEGVSIEQWPESFEFVIFDEANRLTRYVPPSPIDDKGKLDGQRASIYGKLFIPSLSQNSLEQEVSLFIFYPKAYYEVSRAYVKVFEEDGEETHKAYGPDVDDYAYFANDLRLEIPVFISTSPDGLKMTSQQIGAFVSELTHQKK